jgi:exonuclease VII small subunit
MHDSYSWQQTTSLASHCCQRLKQALQQVVDCIRDAGANIAAKQTNTAAIAKSR